MRDDFIMKWVHHPIKVGVVKQFEATWGKDKVWFSSGDIEYQ